MQSELCPENHTPQSSLASEVKREVPPALPHQEEMVGSVVGRNGRIYKLKPDAHKRHELYSTWKEMRTRCFNPKRRDFKYYGGRGISICERWNNFKSFVLDMGPRPSKQHEIDRINENGNYEPGNCRWATRTEQLQHTSRNVYIEYNGQKLTLSNWSRKIGVAIETLRSRLRRGWSLSSALSSEKHRPGNGKMAWETRRKNLISRT